MKFNPIHRRLSTDAGVLIKTLHCPKSLRDGDVIDDADGREAVCLGCERTIVNVAGHSEQMILDMVRRDPSTCLKVDLNAPNIRVINHHD